ncbi:hypothetical protein H5410_062192 [Solanum commersonii]|uniref:Uncharacterized protein n=1 Tax=Solanum commersonii TaxID=4109 RepID=A0A9J5WA66_SOLCO|nr:hypothetical protein H5410_062192 [Solanum commersonii]
MSLINSKVSQKVISSSVHLEDILEGSLLYAELHVYLSQKQSDTFASIAKYNIDDIRSYERLAKKKFRGKKNPGRYSSDIYLTDYTSRVSHTKPVHWGISSMKERHISLNKVPSSFTYWDYINAFSKVLYYNNERHKHTWFIKIIFVIWNKLNTFISSQNSRFHGSINGLQKIVGLYCTKIQDYGTMPHKGIVANNSVKHIARRISIQDGNKQEMIKSIWKKSEIIYFSISLIMKNQTPR